MFQYFVIYTQRFQKKEKFRNYYIELEKYDNFQKDEFKKSYKEVSRKQREINKSYINYYSNI
jgi:hypothetical protein